MFINKVSPSKIKVYDECKAKYMYKYVFYLKDEYNKNTTKDALQFGSYIHKIFEDGVNCSSLVSLKELATNLRPNYHFNGYSDEKIIKCLENFLRFNDTLTEHVSTEQIFSVDVIDDYAVNGIIDRIVKGKTGKYLVIDYKTSKRPATKKDLFNDHQMIIYAYAVSKMYKVPIEDITLAHYYPHLDKLVTVKYTGNHVGLHMKKLTQKVWEIRKRKKHEFPPMLNQFCDWCGYKELCPKFGGTVPMLEEAIKAKKATKKRVPLGIKPNR